MKIRESYIWPFIVIKLIRGNFYIIFVHIIFLPCALGVVQILRKRQGKRSFRTLCGSTIKCKVFAYTGRLKKSIFSLTKYPNESLFLFHFCIRMHVVWYIEDFLTFSFCRWIFFIKRTTKWYSQSLFMFDTWNILYFTSKSKTEEKIFIKNTSCPNLKWNAFYYRIWKLHFELFDILKET